MRLKLDAGLLPVPLMALAMLLGLCLPASAQTFYGSVVGTVTDATGAVVANGTVTLTDLGTNDKRTTTTDSAGDYRFVNLVPATYRIDVETAGFKHFVRSSVEVRVDTATRINPSMELGAVTETVEVSTATPILQTETGSLGSEVEGKTIQEMPLNGRNTLNLMELVPGVVPQGNTSGAAAANNGGSTSSAAWGNYQIGGGMPLQSSMYLDGAPINIMNKNFTALVPTQDVVQEFKVETSAPSPEFGRFAGGVVNMTTKSGSSSFHGSVYEYFRNNVLNANNFFNKRAGVRRPEFNQNQYGGTVSGPAWKNKVFFFYGYEQIAIRTGVPTSTNVPTAALRAGIFSTALFGLSATATSNTTNNPCGAASVGQATCTDTLSGCVVNGPAATGNSTPGSWTIANLSACENPTAKVLGTFYPLPNNTTNPTYNYITNVSAGTNGHQQTGRIDYELSPRQRIFGRFTFWPLVDEAPVVLAVVGAYNTAGSQTHNHTNQLVVGDTITFNPTTILEVRADYFRQYGDAIPPGLQGGSINESAFGAAFGTLSPYMSFQDLPFADFTGGTQLHNFFNFTFNNLTKTYYNNYHLDGSITKIVGKHTLKFGAEGRLLEKDDEGTTQNPSGTFAFSADLAGDEWANFLRGTFDTGTLTTFKPVTTFNYYKGAYINDTWQANPKLTLNLGVRWELPGGIAEGHDNLTVLLPGTVDPYTGITGTAGLVNSGLYSNRSDLAIHNDLFGPRFGFAYRLTESTVIRGGYAMTYLSPDLQIGAYANASLVSTVTTANKNSATVATYTLSNPFPATTQYPNGVGEPTGRTNPAFMTNYIGQAVSAPYPFEPYPSSQETNISIGHQIGSSFLVDVGYAHSLGLHLPSLTAGLDQVSDANIATYGYQLSNKAATSIIYDGVTLASAYQTLGQTLRPFPAYSNYSNNAAYHGTTVYDALQLKVQKRFSKTGQIGLAYTWMKLLGDTDSVLVSQETKSSGVAGSGEGAYQDYYNPRAERSVYSYDVPNRLVINYVLNLPFGHGQRFGATANTFENTLISGWEMTGITTLQSGYPTYMYTSGNYLSKYFGAGTIRPNYMAGCTKTIADSGYDRTLTGHTWFNTACFTPPTSVGANGAILTGANAYAFGNESRTDEAVKSSGVDNFDFSLVKSTPIHEQVALQLRVEFFNIFNRVQFGPPVTAADNALFGQVANQANQPRLIQAALRLNF